VTQFPDTYLPGSASKAVDGNTPDHVVGEMCAHTDKGNRFEPAWWRVDLKAYYSLTGITIYNINQHCEQEMYTLALVNNPSLSANINDPNIATTT